MAAAVSHREGHFRDANPNQRIAIFCSIALPCVNPGVSFPSRLLSQNSNGAANVWQPPCVVYQACCWLTFRGQLLEYGHNAAQTPRSPDPWIRIGASGYVTAISPAGYSWISRGYRRPTARCHEKRRWFRRPRSAVRGWPDRRAARTARHHWTTRFRYRIAGRRSNRCRC